MNFEFENIKHLFNLKVVNKEWEQLVINNYKGGVRALNKLKLWEWVRTFQPSEGFVFSSDSNVIKMMEETDDDGHSGASFACMMRDLQQAACILIPETECDMEVCAICLNEDLNKKVVLDCGHKFHLLCISYVYKTCPLCRGQTVPSYLGAK